jgi:DNA polymerase-4
MVGNMISRTILHLDLDAFFCAVEELYNPSLRGIAFAVGGRPSERGVIASCSYAARQFGIHSAMPTTSALHLCPDLVLIKSHHKRYRIESTKVMKYLSSITNHFEQISIDEAFLDISQISQPVHDLAILIQNNINTNMHLPCSIGIASNKLVAKIANDYGKSTNVGNHSPNTITIVTAGDEAAFLAPLPVRHLWGIGPKTAERLARLGVSTIGDLAKIPEGVLINQFGKMGKEFTLRSKGIDNRPVISHHESKSLSNEVTFAKDKTNLQEVTNVLLQLSKKVSNRLCKENKTARTIKIKLRWYDFDTITRQFTYETPINDYDHIYAAAHQLLIKNWGDNKPIRLIGVGVSNLDYPTPIFQLSYFDTEENRHDNKLPKQLEQAITIIQQRFGENSLVRGSRYKLKTGNNAGAKSHSEI